MSSRTLAIALLGIGCLLAGGCGKEEAAAPTPAPPVKAAVQEPGPAPKQEKPKAEAPSPPGAQKLDAMLEKILALEQEGQFAEAMQLCREAGSRFGSHPKAAALNELSARLRDEKKAAAQASFALEKLTSGRPEVAEVARRELLDAGDAALILLRKTLRDDSGVAAIEAAKVLVQARDKRAPQAFAAKLLRDPAAPLRATLCDGLKALIDLADHDTLSALYAAVRKDATGAKWELASVLCVALDKRCGGDAAKLGELLGDPAAANVLKAYVTKAIEADDESAAEWARSVAPALGIVVNGLRGSYFRGTNFEKLLVERLDTWINFTDKTLPIPEGQAEGISARWTGYLLVAKEGDYMVAAEYDDGLRLWIDGKLVLEDWAEHGATEQQAAVGLAKGFHEFKLEFMNAKGEARVKLSWDGPGFGKRVIGGDALKTLPWKGMRKP